MFAITPYHVKYFAWDLTRHAPEGLDRLSMSLFDAKVDLNFHQIEAALFALRSPLSKGVILADEVGLGKTIEAGLVICQYWAERQRHRQQQEIFKVEDEIMTKRDALIDDLEKRLAQKTATEQLFTIRWVVK